MRGISRYERVEIAKTLGLEEDNISLHSILVKNEGEVNNGYIIQIYIYSEIDIFIPNRIKISNESYIIKAIIYYIQRREILYL